MILKKIGAIVGKRGRQITERDLSIDDIKQKTRILIIDDESREDLVNYLKRDGWACRHKYDIESLEDVDIKDSHIICVDIRGVGKALNKADEGLDLLLSIKKKYPQKKTIQYSSQSTHNYFHEANSYTDKRIHKSSGDLEVFSSAIEELALTCFNWNHMVAHTYNAYKNNLPEDMAYDVFEKQLKRIVSTNRSGEPDYINKALSVGANVATILSMILQLYGTK